MFLFCFFLLSLFSCFYGTAWSWAPNKKKFTSLILLSWWQGSSDLLPLINAITRVRLEKCQLLFLLVFDLLCCQVFFWLFSFFCVWFHLWREPLPIFNQLCMIIFGQYMQMKNIKPFLYFTCIQNYPSHPLIGRQKASSDWLGSVSCDMLGVFCFLFFPPIII